MKVYDLFPFFNELELLELRVEELRGLVTYTGLVEMPVTFTGLPKPLYFSRVGLEFAGTGNIHVYVPPTYPSGPHPTVDWFQRSQLGKHLADAEPDDIVMISDVDEIPNRNIIRNIVKAGIDEPICLQSRLYYHRVDLFDPSCAWSGTIVTPMKCFTDAQEMRHKRCVLPQIPNAGWHFSWLGKAEAIAHKLTAVDIERDSNDQMQNPGQNLAFLQECYETGKDMFGRREHDKIEVPIVPGMNQPHEIEAWLSKYPQYAK